MQYNKGTGITYDLDKQEIFKNVETVDVKPTTIKAYFPKLMPRISGGNWITKTVIDSNMLINSEDCKVTFPRYVESQGFYTINKYKNESPDFTSKATEVNGVLKVLPGNRFLAEILHDDVMEMHFTGKV